MPTGLGGQYRCPHKCLAAETAAQLALRQQAEEDDLGFKPSELAEPAIRQGSAGDESRDPDAYAERVSFYNDTLSPGAEPCDVVWEVGLHEAQGSTFINEGVALPHARLEGLTAPQVALGFAHAGVLDADTTKLVEAAALLLSPAVGANVHLQLLARGGRGLQDRGLRRALTRARTPAEAVGATQDVEAASSPRAAAAGGRSG